MKLSAKLCASEVVVVVVIVFWLSLFFGAKIFKGSTKFEKKKMKGRILGATIFYLTSCRQIETLITPPVENS